MRHKLLFWLRLPGRTVRRTLPRRIRRMVVIPLAFVALGTVAYPLIEGPKWGLFDGLYMTVITLTTLGYGEIPEPLSRPGRAFTMFLALSGVFTLFYIGTDVIRSVLTGELRDLLGKERMDDQLKHLTGHAVVCGYGRMGKIVCEELNRLHQSFVVIDPAAPAGDWPFPHGLRLQGDATEDEVLRKARIEHARAVITVVGSDASNLYVALSARLLNPTVVIVARAEEHEAEAKLRKVGANQVVSPYLAGGHVAVHAVFAPTLHRATPGAAHPDLAALHLEEVPVPAGGPVAGRPLRDSGLLDRTGVYVVRIVRPDGGVDAAPAGGTPVAAGATLIAVGTRAQLAAAAAFVRGG
jgi:voltage-gated potassium channel